MTVLNYVRLLGGCPRKGEAYRQRGHVVRPCRAHDAPASCIRVVDTQVGELPKAGAGGIYPYLAVAAGLVGLAGWCGMRRKEYAMAK